MSGELEEVIALVQGEAQPLQASSCCHARTALSPTSKAWMHGAHRRVSDEHLPVYLDEYVFRHNRPRHPDARLPDAARLGALHDPTTYRQITLHDRAA